MIPLARAVSRGAQKAFVVADLPFGTYEVSPQQAVESSIRMMKEAQPHAIKFEGGRRVAAQVKAVVDAGIPFVGHLGFTPQSENMLGGPAYSGPRRWRVRRDARRRARASRGGRVHDRARDGDLPRGREAHGRARHSHDRHRRRTAHGRPGARVARRARHGRLEPQLRQALWRGGQGDARRGRGLRRRGQGRDVPRRRTTRSTNRSAPDDHRHRHRQQGQARQGGRRGTRGRGLRRPRPRQPARPAQPRLHAHRPDRLRPDRRRDVRRAGPVRQRSMPWFTLRRSPRPAR